MALQTELGREFEVRGKLKLHKARGELAINREGEQPPGAAWFPDPAPAALHELPACRRLAGAPARAEIRIWQPETSAGPAGQLHAALDSGVATGG